MKVSNGTDPGDSRGVDRLRAAIEEVAGEMETHPSTSSLRSTPRRPLRFALGAAALLALLLLGTWWILPRRVAEVEVLELRIHGRDVRAQIVDDKTPDTIVVIPLSHHTTPVGVARIAAGGSR
jgi:hypothetical protein